MSNEAFEDALDKDLIIDETNFSEEFIKQASLLAYYGIAYQNAATRHRDAETELEYIEANSMQDARTSAGDKKVTEGYLKEIVTLDATCHEHRKLVNKLQSDSEILKVQYYAIQEKGKMLMSFGGVRRAELESNVRILTNGGR